MDDQKTLDRISTFLGETGKDIDQVKLLIRGESVSAFEEDTDLIPGDKVILFRRENFSNYLTLLHEEPSPPSHTAEEWLALQGFTSVRLVTLLDLENQLAARDTVSEKLINVRAWINAILAAYVMDPSPKSDWPPAPFDFQETTAEAFAQLTAD
jgi:hypothetical protein